ncbi:MAG: hypothetical protein LBT98_02455 [Puniceicoccales bacterium]|nr:hypothetical protein [Puniceicoccales bacterium]
MNGLKTVEGKISRRIERNAPDIDSLPEANCRVFPGAAQIKNLLLGVGTGVLSYCIANCVGLPSSWSGTFAGAAGGMALALLSMQAFHGQARPAAPLAGKEKNRADGDGTAPRSPVGQRASSGLWNPTASLDIGGNVMCIRGRGETSANGGGGENPGMEYEMFGNEGIDRFNALKDDASLQSSPPTRIHAIDDTETSPIPEIPS